MAKQQKRASAARRQRGNVRFMLIWGVTESANPYFKRRMFKKKLMLNFFISAEKGDYKILYCLSSFFGWQTEQKICWIHSPACLLDKRVLNEVENVNDRTVVQCQFWGNTGRWASMFNLEGATWNQSKIICMWFSNMPHPTDELFPIFARLKGNVQNDRVNLVCHLQQLFPLFSGHDPNFTVSWCRAKSQKGSLCCCCCCFFQPCNNSTSCLIAAFLFKCG